MRGTQFGNGTLGSTRVNTSEIKGKSEEERIKFVYDNLIGKIKSECKEYDLDITARYKLVKMVMDNTTNEVREYADKIKRDLNVINSISDDIDVEDSGVGKPPLTDGTKEGIEEDKSDIYNLIRALNGTKLDVQIKKGVKLIRFKNEVLSVSRDGIQFKSLEFNDNLIHAIRVMLSQLFNVEHDEKGNLFIKTSDFIFDGRDLLDGDNKEFELKLYPTKNVEEYFKEMNTVEFEVTEFEKKTGLRNLLLNSDLSNYMNEGIKVFIFQGNDLIAMPSEKRLDLKFEVEDAEILVDSIGKIFGHMNLSSKKYMHLKSNMFELVVAEGPDEYLTFKLDMRKFPGLPVKEIE